MRAVSFLILAALLLSGGAGCLSEQEKTDLREEGKALAEQRAFYEERIKEGEALIADLRAKMAEGKLDISTGIAAIAEVEKKVSEFVEKGSETKASLERINKALEGKSFAEKVEGWVTILSTILGGGGLGALATRWTRGPSSKAHKNPDGTLR